MTYEWGYTYRPPQAVSPLPEVRRVIDYAVTEIPREKIFLGIPNYAYDWTLPFVRGESRARSLSNVAAVQLASDKKAEIQFDETAQTPYFHYYERDPAAGDTREHVVWFDDARSMDQKLRLLRDYALAGGSVWNIMRYFPQLWLVMNSLYTIDRNT
jgi:spore germination protein